MGMTRREAVAALMALPSVAHVSRARVAPDDVIVLECDEHLSHDGQAQCMALLKQVWPNHQCLVLAPGMRLKLATKDGMENPT